MNFNDFENDQALLSLTSLNMKNDSYLLLMLLQGQEKRVRHELCLCRNTIVILKDIRSRNLEGKIKFETFSLPKILYCKKLQLKKNLKVEKVLEKLKRKIMK